MWKMRTSPYGDLIFYAADVLDTTELHAAIECIEQTLMHSPTRAGYSIETKGTCAKGPQGLWWSVNIEFENDADAWLVHAAFEPSNG